MWLFIKVVSKRAYGIDVHKTPSDAKATIRYLIHVNPMVFATLVAMIVSCNSYFVIILGRELGPSGVSPNQRSRWKLAFSPLKYV